MGEVAAGKIFDSIVYGMLIILTSALGLYLFGNFVALAIAQKATLGVYGEHLIKMLALKNGVWEYNLTHILLFAVVITILSIRDKRPARKEEKKEKKD